MWTTTELNLRDAPTLDSNIIAVIPANAELMRVGRHGEWTIVQVDGVNYFVCTAFVSKQEPPESTEWALGKIPIETVKIDSAASQNATGAYLGDWTITFYCNCSECCGIWAGGATASGTTPTEGRTVACGSLDFGTQVYIDGLGEYIVEDRGVEGNWIDVYLESHEACNQMGMMSRAVYLTE